MSQPLERVVLRPILCPLGDGTIFITMIPSGNPEIRSMMISDGPLMPPNDEKLLELFTMFRRIPRRIF